MLRYIVKRIGLMVPTLLLIMVVGFGIMRLPASDYVERYVNSQAAAGNTGMMAQADNLRKQFGLDKSPVERFFIWTGNFARGDFGSISRQNGATSPSGRPARISSMAASAAIRAKIDAVIGHVAWAPAFAARSARMTGMSRTSPAGMAAI